MTAPNPRLKRIQERRLTPVQERMGLSWVTTDDGGDPAETGAVQIEITDDLRGPWGSLDGGAIATLVDVSGASCAAYHYGPRVVTLQVIINFLSAGLVGPAVASATPARIGKTRATIEVRIVDRGRDDRLMVLATVTVAPLLDKGSSS
jgi:uncharacterized protein (TIGR00369 family)